MTIIEDTLARTFEPIACMECERAGLTVDECARILHAEQMAARAFADHDITHAATPAEVVSPARAKAEAERRLRELAKVNRATARVAIIGPDGFPLVVLDRSSRTFQRHLELDRLTPTGTEGVYQLS